MNPAIKHLPRREQDKLLSREARNRMTGNWGEWETIPLPNGNPLGGGWNKEIREARKNRVFCVLIRPLPDGNVHLAVCSLSGRRPSWHEMQRIKNDIAGPEATAVEVYPPQSEMVDEADMFHIWTVDPLPFTIWSQNP
jgi:hypothetical protein